MMESRPRIEIVRVPSTERGNFRPLDGVQLRAAYSHVRIGTYCPEEESEPNLERGTPRRIAEVKPSHELTRKYKKSVATLPSIGFCIFYVRDTDPTFFDTSSFRFWERK
jgi:hypothetical protein